MFQGDPALWRRIASALLLFSFFWISYASQTHIHGQLPARGVASDIVKAFHAHTGHIASSPVKPGSDDTADCPLCQAVSLTGVAIIPVLVVLLLLQDVVRSALPHAMERSRASHFGLAHQTRGPPIL